jgi:hypothetical protein
MTELQNHLEAPLPSPTVGTLLRQVGVSFFLFAFILTALLALSALLLLPALTQVSVGGRERSGAEVHSSTAQLLGDITRTQAQRDESVLPLSDPEYQSLKSQRQAVPSFVPLYEGVLHCAVALVPVKDAIVVQSVTLDAPSRTLSVIGDIRNVGPQSMTVLARFVSELGRLPFVSSVSQPLFQRLDDPVLGMHSPYSLTLTLR